MKKFLILFFLLFACFFTTACINNLAIQELNQIGKNYLDKADYDAAIARFQSCLDLDENIFETRYNLGVAYIGKEDYKNAINNLKAAVKLNPASADAYYSLALALENRGFELQKEENLDDEKTNEGIDLIKEAVQTYEKYLTLLDKSDEVVQDHITDLKGEIEKTNNKNISTEAEMPDDINSSRD